MTKRLKMTKGSGNVFHDLGFPPGEAENLRLRSELLIEIEGYVRRNGLTQREIAKRLNITQPRLNDLLKGKLDKFSLDALVNIASQTGLRVTLKIKRAA